MYSARGAGLKLQSRGVTLPTRVHILIRWPSSNPWLKHSASESVVLAAHIHLRPPSGRRSGRLKSQIQENSSTFGTSNSGFSLPTLPIMVGDTQASASARCDGPWAGTVAADVVRSGAFTPSYSGAYLVEVWRWCGHLQRWTISCLTRRLSWVKGTFLAQ